ncbi:MAG: hypothetical protein IKX78_03425 [Clostridia bacterium]|nr:hypothetical protein [Clostridia bacterium]
METMTDVWSELSGADRARCWKLFKKLCSALIYEKRGVLYEHAPELRELADEFNSASKSSHFDLSRNDETFLSSLLDELEEIKKRSRLCD